VASGCTAFIESAGNGWYKCGFSQSVPSGQSLYMHIYPTDADNTITVTASGTNGILIWGAQVNIGSTAEPYFPTTDRLNVPRLTYQNGGGGCPSLLLEKQSTNSILYSEQFDNVLWAKAGGTVTANNATSPDGTQNADLFTADGTTTQHYVLQTQTVGAKTISFFVKMGTQRYVQILTSASANALANYDLQTGSVGGLGSASTASIIDYGNGWWRIILTSTDVLSGNIYLCYSQSLVQGRFPSTTSTGTIWIWGAMAENGATYPTSYIPTTSASATRVADACFKTGISSLIGQTEGVIFADLVFLNPEPMFFLSTVGTDWLTDSIYFELSNTTNYIAVSSVKSSTGVGNASTNIAPTPNSRYKIAVQYSGTSFNLYVNGTKYSGGRSANALCSKLYLNELGTLASAKNNLQTKFNEVVTFPTALTDSELAQLTGNQNYTINQAYASYGVASESPNCVQP
jgi:hypothetical protein